MSTARTTRVAARPGAIPGSGIRAVAAAAWARPDTIHLEFGEPSFATPAHIVAAADDAARAGRTHYGPTAGLPEFRAAVAAKLVRDNGWPDADPAAVVAAAGGVGALFAAYSALLDPGDEILVPDPGWPNFVALAYAVGANPVRYPLDRATGAPPDPTTLDDAGDAQNTSDPRQQPGEPDGCGVVVGSAGRGR